MAIGDISAFTPIRVTLDSAAFPNAATLIVTVPASEEWTLRFARAVCLIGTGGTAPTFSVGTSSSGNELCFNEVLPIPSATVSGAKNILGPDFVTIPPSTPIYARASAASAVRLTITGTKKQVS